MSDSPLMQAIAALPPTVNPYAWLKTYIWRQVSPEVKPWAKAVISLNIAAFILSFFVALYALLARRKQKSLWLFRVQDTHAGRLILPNTTCLFSLMSLIFAPLLVWNCAIYLRQADNDNVDTTPNMIGYAVTWPPMLFCIWLETWSLTVAILLAYPKIKVKAIYLNTFFIAMLPIPSICNVPTFSIAAVRLHAAFAKYRQIGAALQPAIDTWTPGTAFQSSPEAMAMMGEFAALGARFFPAVSTACWTHLVGHVIIAVTFVPASLLYFRILRRQLGYSSSGSSSFTASASSYGTNTAGRQRDLRMSTLRAGYTAMVWECGAVFTSVVAYVALCIWVALRSKEILTTTLESNLLFTLPYSIWALTGCPANIVIASRLFNRRDEVKPFDAVYEPFGCLSLVAGIKVQTEVSIAVDAGDVELDEKARQTVIAFKPDPKRNSLGEHEIGFSDSKSDLDVARATWRT